jgi:signal transduction histidine kinase/CheY-like chemotaxis protein
MVTSIYEDQDGSLWIGTYGGGLNRLRNGTFKSITFKDGLFDDILHYVLEDDRGYLWMSCNKGIFKASKRELNDFCDGKTSIVHCVAYNEKDGMKSRECNGIGQPSGWKDREGKLWFPTIKGVVMIDPGNIKINHLPPPVKIKEIIVDNKKILPPFSSEENEEKLVLSAGKEQFDFHYTGLSLLVPEKVRFKYKLEGFDREWRDVGTRRTAYYTKLPPGNYTFRVKACNNEGIWNETGASVSFYLKPHFYQAWWFYLACGLGVIFLAWSSYRWRVRLLKKREEELEKLVDHRTAELQKANETARREREIAEAANRSKSLFLARMSHEIRTPMNSVIGFSEMLIDTRLDEEQLYYCNTIKQSGDALISIIDDILDFSKIEAGRLSFDPTDFDPEAVAFEVCELILPRISERPIEILCRVDPKLPPYVKHDPGRFRQVLINLMGNAAKFTKEGEILLAIDMEKKEQNRLKLHCQVRDTGIGIHPDKREAIFEMFQQADNSVTRKFGGTGLGLPICKQIAKQMEGDIWAESTPGKGSTFHFTAWVEKSIKTSPQKPLMTNLTGKRVLMVDDNRNNLDIMDNILKKHGMFPILRTTAEEVMPTIQENLASGTPFDLCILDIHLPDKSGYDVAKQIRHQPLPISNLPLLALISSSTRQSKKFPGSGFDGLLPKPVQEQKLLSKITQMLLPDRDKARETEVPGESKEIAAQHPLMEGIKPSVNILLVEDNPVNRRLAWFMLTKAGYQLDMVENGKQAVEKFTANPECYDLIFMDIQMPEMDGREATKMIRAKGFDRIPIIAMTAESMKGDYEKCLEAGMNDYISKPIRREVMFNMIKKWVIKGK